MKKITEEGLTLMEGQGDYVSLCINSKRIEDCIKYLKTYNLKYISINPYIDYYADNIDFLVEVEDFLEGLTILSQKFNYSIINNLHKLKKLGFADNKVDTIDLSNFRNLESLACEYSPRLIGIETCKNLKDLVLTGYKPKNKDLTDLPELDELTELYLFQTNIVSLNGIEKYKKLKKIQIFSATKLESISALKYLSNGLVEIEIENCKRIKDYEVLGNLKLMKRLLILDSGEIKSLSFVKNLHNLSFLSFGSTNILDGNLSYCEGINYVGFDNKRHYSHKFEYFKEKNQKN